MRYTNQTRKNRAGRGLTGGDPEMAEAVEDYQSNDELPEDHGDEEES
jgi:hypothetical protein